MTDVQVRGKKVALLDSSDNIIYTLPDSAGTAGDAMVTDGAGKLFFGGINLNAVLTAGDSSNLNATILGNVKLGNVTANTLHVDRITTFAGIGANTTHGYHVSGRQSPPNTSQVLNGDRFPFASDDNSTTIGDVLTEKMELSSPAASSTHGYVIGGQYGSSGANLVDRIQKFSFAASSTGTDIGELSAARKGANLGAIQSSTHGYAAGGSTSTPPFVATNIIDRFPFAADGSSVDVGDLAFVTSSAHGHSSESRGYASGMFRNPGAVRFQDMQRFPFASDLRSVSMGTELALEFATSADASSGDAGFIAGGINGSSTTQDDIQRFPFATDNNSTAFLATLTMSRYGAAGSSSSNFGYATSGASTPPFTLRNEIRKYPFSSSDLLATDVGDLSESRWGGMGTQG